MTTWQSLRVQRSQKGPQDSSPFYKQACKSAETSEEKQRIGQYPRGHLGSHDYNCSGDLQFFSAI